MTILPGGGTGHHKPWHKAGEGQKISSSQLWKNTQGVFFESVEASAQIFPFAQRQVGISVCAAAAAQGRELSRA